MSTCPAPHSKVLEMVVRAGIACIWFYVLDVVHQGVRSGICETPVALASQLGQVGDHGGLRLSELFLEERQRRVLSLLVH